jgi:hypothetical protein
MDMHLTSVYRTSAYLTGMHLMSVYLMGMHLSTLYAYISQVCISRTYMS